VQHKGLNNNQMMKNKKTIPLILLVIFTFFLSYTFYESEIKYSGNERDYYFKYFIIFIFLIIFSIISFFLKKEILNNILTIFFSFLFGIYLINIYLIITKEEVINNRMGLFELYKNYKNNDKNISVSMKPQLMIGDDGYPLFSFSDRSNRKTLHCNEGGYFSIFDTDRYGFNNPDEQWGKKIIDFFLVGDSHTHGSCVNEPDTISGNLRKTTNMGVLNLGFSKMGPLQEYAVLREYLPTIKTNRVLWMYSETNDLTDLSDELNNELLKKYLKDETFLQNLHKRQNEIDRKLENVLLSIYEQKKKGI